MTRLWRAFEESPCLMEVTEVWRRRLGKEFEPLRHLFSVTDIVAARFPVGATHRYLRITADDRGVVGIDDETGEQHPLTRGDVVCHRLNVRALAKELCDALDFGHRFEKLGSTYHTTRIGTLPARLESRPVYLDLNRTCGGLRRAVEEVARHAGRSYLLLHPTGRPANSDIEHLIRLTGGCLVPLRNLVDVDATGQFVTGRDPQKAIAESLGIDFDSASPRYLFKLGGSKFRMLAFDSDPVIVKESVGLWYIAQLLANPGTRLTATELESLRTGVNRSAASGSKGEVIDPQAKREYRDRLTKLDEEIEELASLGDSLRLEELHGEREQLLATLQKSTGLGGKIREDFAADSSRKAVSKAIRRAIDVVEQEHPVLGRHLDDSIRMGLEIVYSPSSPVDWTL